MYNNIQTQYMVSDSGYVRDYVRNVILKPYRNNSGYLYVSLTININGEKKRVRKAIHQMVAQTYIPNPDNKPYVNHIDGNKDNNEPCNLEWTTPSENNFHAYRTGLHNPIGGETVHFARYKNAQVEEACNLLANGIAPLEVQEIVGIPAKTLYEIRSGQIWKSISKKYSFPNYKYPRMVGVNPEIRLRIDELAKYDMAPMDIMRELNIPLSDRKMYKRIRDCKYRLKKAQRLANNSVDV